MEKSRLFPVLFYQFQHILHLCTDGLIVFSSVGPQATGTILNAFFGIAVTATALVPQTVKRTIAEKAAESLRIGTGMTGKIFAVLMLEKIIIRHILSSQY